MTERGVGFSSKDHHRVSRVTLAFERGELGRQPGSPPPRTPRHREPIRAMLLDALGPTEEALEWQGDVCVGVKAIVTEFDNSRCRWLIRTAYRPTADHTFKLRQNGDETADIAYSTTPVAMQAILEGLPGMTDFIESVEGNGSVYGPVDDPATIAHNMWLVTMKPDWPGAPDFDAPATLPLTTFGTATAICQQTGWKLTDHIETIHLPFGVPQNLRCIQGSLALANHFPGRGFVLTYPECIGYND